MLISIGIKPCQQMDGALLVTTGAHTKKGKIKEQLRTKMELITQGEERNSVRTKICEILQFREMTGRHCRGWMCAPYLLDHVDPTFRFLVFVIHKTVFVVVFLQHRLNVHREKHLKENMVSRILQLFLT